MNDDPCVLHMGGSPAYSLCVLKLIVCMHMTMSHVLTKHYTVVLSTECKVQGLLKLKKSILFSVQYMWSPYSLLAFTKSEGVLH